MEVIRVRPLAVAELVQGGADLLTTDRRADARRAPAIALALRLVVELGREDVEASHGRILTEHVPAAEVRRERPSGARPETGSGRRRSVRRSARRWGCRLRRIRTE